MTPAADSDDFDLIGLAPFAAASPPNHRPLRLRPQLHLHQGLAVEHDLVADLAGAGEPRSLALGMSSATVTVTSTWSPIRTGAWKLSVCDT